jgi:formate hydrogenlyase subunit 4
MTKALAWVAMVALIVLLTSTLVAIWLQLAPKDDLFRLTQLLLSWQVIAGGLVIGGGSTFSQEIKHLLTRGATQRPQ